MYASSDCVQKHASTPLATSSIRPTIDLNSFAVRLSLAGQPYRPVSSGPGPYWRYSMFESLAERIREDERGTVNNTQRPIFWIAVAEITAVVLGAIYFGMKLA